MRENSFDNTIQFVNYVLIFIFLLIVSAGIFATYITYNYSLEKKETCNAFDGEFIGNYCIIENEYYEFIDSKHLNKIYVKEALQ